MGTKDFLFATIVFPLSLFVAVTFWTLYAIDRELVFPQVMDAIYPRWLNHLVHTFILVTLVEAYIVDHAYPCRKTAFTTITGLTSLYLGWVFYIAYVSDFWVYPVLRVLGFSGRAVFISFLMIFLMGLYVFCEKYCCCIWGGKEEVSVKKKRKAAKIS